MAERGTIDRACEECAQPFKAAAGNVRKGNGRFCSQKCARAHQWRQATSVEAARVRFEALVDKNGPVPSHVPEIGNCWLWLGAADKKKGYGAVGFRRKTHGAHRFAFFLADGRWPEPCALHRCDNRLCVRRSHLFEGTEQDNTDDMMAKGRGRWLTPGGDDHWSKRHPERVPRGDRSGARKHPERLSRGDSHYARTHPEKLARGERSGTAKLTEDKVRDILVSKEKLSVLAARHGVTEALISMVRLRKIWKHVDMPLAAAAGADQ